MPWRAGCGAENIYCRIMPDTATADEVLASRARSVILASGCTGRAAQAALMRICD